VNLYPEVEFLNKHIAETLSTRMKFLTQNIATKSIVSFKQIDELSDIFAFCSNTLLAYLEGDKEIHNHITTATHPVPTPNTVR
jgi:hypothetical protein